MTIKEAEEYAIVSGLCNDLNDDVSDETVSAIGTIENAIDCGYVLIDIEKLIGRIELYQYDAIPKREIIRMFKEAIDE